MPQNGEVKKKVREYSEEIREAVLEEAGRTTILAAAEAWGIPHGTIAYWQARRRRRAREEAQATVVAEPGGRSREQGLPEEASSGAACPVMRVVTHRQRLPTYSNMQTNMA